MASVTTNNKIIMKKNLFLGLFALVLTASTTFCASLNTVLVTTNQLDIPYTGTYGANRLVKLGNYSLPWHQAGKSADIFATLPANIPAGTYTLSLYGLTPVSVAIGSVRAEADLANLIISISNSIVASVNNQIITTSNSIVASLTKNFTTAYAFGDQTVNPSSPVSFSSFIGDWTTNGTDFKIPATGVYQISFAIINLVGPKSSVADIPITIVSNASTNGLGYYSVFTDAREALI